MWLLDNVKLHTWLILVACFIFLLDSIGPDSPAFLLPHPDPAGFNHDCGQVISPVKVSVSSSAKE